MLKQQTCGPPSYPKRVVNDDASDWTTEGCVPISHEAPILAIADWADKLMCGVEELGERLTYANGGWSQTVSSAFGRT